MLPGRGTLFFLGERRKGDRACSDAELCFWHHRSQTLFVGRQEMCLGHHANVFDTALLLPLSILLLRGLRGVGVAHGALLGLREERGVRKERPVVRADEEVHVRDTVQLEHRQKALHVPAKEIIPNI